MKKLYEVLNDTKFNIEDYNKEELTDMEKKKLYKVLDEKNRKNRFGRKFINIAALVAIMITGVVFATGRMNLDILEPEADEIARYNITMETEGIELSKETIEGLLSFARDINDTFEGMLGQEYIRKAESYDELEEYLGVKFLQSPILNTTFNPFALMYPSYEGGKGIIINSTKEGDKLLSVTIFSPHRIPKTDGSVSLTASLRTPEAKKLWGDYEIKVGHFDPEDMSKRNVTEEDYITGSGINAKIIHIGETDRYTAYFEEDSIVYSLESSYLGQELESKELLIEVLESFER